MSKYIYISLLLLTLLFTACASDEQVEPEKGRVAAISFNASGEETTRADGDNVSLRNYVNDFRVYGAAKVGDKYESVFKNYVVWYDELAYTSTTNTTGWEYVGEYKALTGVSTTDQVIKYWDFDCPEYVFWGTAGARYNATVGFNADGTLKTMTLSGIKDTQKADDILFYSLPTVVEKGNDNTSPYTKPVKLTFMPFMAKVRVGFFETIPGYVLKDMNFYSDASTLKTTNADVVTLFGDNAFASTEDVTFTYVYPDANADPPVKEHGVTWGYASASSAVDSKEVGKVQYQTLTSHGYYDEDGITGVNTMEGYLGRTQNTPSYAHHDGADEEHYVYVLPMTHFFGDGDVGNKPITLKCDYTLVDASDPTNAEKQIKVVGATVTIPAKELNWEPAHKYTYLLKINNLEEITLDLVVDTKWKVGYVHDTTW